MSSHLRSVSLGQIFAPNPDNCARHTFARYFQVCFIEMHDQLFRLLARFIIAAPDDHSRHSSRSTRGYRYVRSRRRIKDARRVIDPRWHPTNVLAVNYTSGARVVSPSILSEVLSERTHDQEFRLNELSPGSSLFLSFSSRPIFVIKSRLLSRIVICRASLSPAW